VSNYSLYVICENTFTTTTGVKRGFLEMVGEGYVDIINGYSGCSLNTAEYIYNVDISGVSYTQSFYTGTTNNDVPSDFLWKQTIENILSGIGDVQSYSLDTFNNTLQIVSSCNGSSDPLADAEVSISLTIHYDVTCLEEIPCP
jgi:hypothetical protein